MLTSQRGGIRHDDYRLITGTYGRTCLRTYTYTCIVSCIHLCIHACMYRAGCTEIWTRMNSARYRHRLSIHPETITIHTFKSRTRHCYNPFKSRTRHIHASHTRMWVVSSHVRACLSTEEGRSPMTLGYASPAASSDPTTTGLEDARDPAL
jgi:hypothetical protein